MKKVTENNNEETLNIEDMDAQTVGEILRNTRLKSGKTLSDVSKDLCIRKVYIEAIESLDYNSLPPVPYGIGFVRSYAEYLGLNSARIVQSYKKTAFPDENDKTENTSDNNSDSSGPKISHIIIGLIGLAGLIGGWSYLSTYKTQEAIEQETIDNNAVEETVVIDEQSSIEEILNEELPVDNVVETDASYTVTPETTSIPEVKSTEATETTEVTEIKTPETIKEDNSVTSAENTVETVKEDNQDTVVDEPLEFTTRIKMVLTGPSWLEVRRGDKILISGIYSKGFKYDIPDSENMVVSVGRYYNVDFYIDGKLTKVATATKQTNIKLDKFLQKNKNV